MFQQTSEQLNWGMLLECPRDAQSECEDDESCGAMREYARPPGEIFRDHFRSGAFNTGMWFRAARSETGPRPEYFLRRGFGAGSEGSIIAYSSSSAIGVPNPSVPVVHGRD
jgi:hypothetical protein